MSFGTEVLFMLMLVFLFVGPKRLPTILGQIARAKAQLENATRKLESELGAEFELHRHDEQLGARPNTAGEQYCIRKFWELERRRRRFV